MLIDAVATHALRTPQAIACVDLETGQRWNYQAFDQLINRAANWLVEQLGSASGDRVATISRNSAAMLVLNLACVRAGAIFTPCNWRLSVPELAVILDDATPAMAFLDEEFLSDALPVKAFNLSELYALIEGFSVAAPIDARRDHHATSTLLYTSGTSGKPKGVMLSENNTLWSQLAFNTGNHASSDSVFMCDMPLFHTAGLLANTRAPLLMGGAVLISKGFDADKTLQRLSDPDLGVTHYFSVPQMASVLWNHPDFDAAKLAHLKVYATGGAPNPKAQVERFINAGIPMSDGFGMTETGSVSAVPVSHSSIVINKAGSAGTLFLSIEGKVVSTEGEKVPVGSTGELWIRGPGVSSGYWNQPEKTAEAFQDGWFKTGDLAYFDEDDYLYMVDRKKDMFISGGENVYPVEVESVIAEFPEVAEVAVVGLPDEKWGEQGVAVLVAAPKATIDIAAIEQYCKSRLAGYKVPRQFLQREKLPYTTTGKIQKNVLVAELKKERSAR